MNLLPQKRNCSDFCATVMFGSMWLFSAFVIFSCGIQFSQRESGESTLSCNYKSHGKAAKVKDKHSILLANTAV